MTTENVIFTNHVVVVGMLDTMMVRDRNAKRDKNSGRPVLIETTRTEGRTRGVGGRWENMTLQVGSPYGGMFALPIELSPDVPGIELLDSAAAETMLAIEGSLQLRQTFDGRFATDRLDARNRSDRGRPTRELQLRVSLVRAPNAPPATVTRRACALAKEWRMDSSCQLIGQRVQTALQRTALYADLAPAPQVAQQLLKQPGAQVASTLDGPLQRFAQENLRQQLGSLRERNVNDGAIIVLDNRSGEILAYVGNAGGSHVDGVAALQFLNRKHWAHAATS